MVTHIYRLRSSFWDCKVRLRTGEEWPVTLMVYIEFLADRDLAVCFMDSTKRRPNCCATVMWYFRAAICESPKHQKFFAFFPCGRFLSTKMFLCLLQGGFRTQCFLTHIDKFLVGSCMTRSSRVRTLISSEILQFYYRLVLSVKIPHTWWPAEWWICFFTRSSVHHWIQFLCKQRSSQCFLHKSPLQETQFGGLFQDFQVNFTSTRCYSSFFIFCVSILPHYCLIVCIYIYIYYNYTVTTSTHNAIETFSNRKGGE